MSCHVMAITTPYFPKPMNMNRSLSLSSKLRPNPPFFHAFSRHLTLALRPFSAPPGSPVADDVRVRVRAKASLEAQQLKKNWLASLSCPLPRGLGLAGDGDGDGEVLGPGNAGADWAIGVDPDMHGAVAVLKGRGSDCSAQVFDSPHLSVLVGGRVRKRLDAKSITELLRSLDVPVGTTAYIEQSMPFPKDGKQGWWSGGFGYGLWIGILVALGFSVIPVPSVSWKRKFELSGSSFTKDDSRRVASALFPSLSLLLKRKKDHGRAEALLIAAYGRGIKMESDSLIALDELIS